MDRIEAAWLRKRPYGDMARIVAEKIKALEKELAEANRVKRDAINELCHKCGRYREEHNGACDGCRWHHGKA